MTTDPNILSQFPVKKNSRRADSCQQQGLCTKALFAVLSVFLVILSCQKCVEFAEYSEHHEFEQARAR